MNTSFRLAGLRRWANFSVLPMDSAKNFARNGLAENPGLLTKECGMLAATPGV